MNVTIFGGATPQENGTSYEDAFRLGQKNWQKPAIRCSPAAISARWKLHHAGQPKPAGMSSA
jgi:hypothetical protein